MRNNLGGSIKFNQIVNFSVIIFLSSLLSACHDWSWIDFLNAESGAEPTDKNYIYKPVPSEDARVFYAGSFEHGFQLFVDGKPYEVRGAGYGVVGNMARIKEYGGNTIRTWGSVYDGVDVLGYHLEQAQANGLMVIAGLWVPHERHGFNYSDPVQYEAQLRAFAGIVEKHKDHPALLMWGLGNEYLIGMTDTNVFGFVQDLAKIIHDIDPNHPTMTVVPHLGIYAEDVINGYIDYVPDVDILGINAYGVLEYDLKTIYPESNWNKPLIVTEFGPNGYWETPVTDWGAFIEDPSGVKRELYKERYQMIESLDYVLGSTVFLWGWKQERTHTLFNLFSEDGRTNEVTDVMKELWSGEAVENRAPNVTGFYLEGFDTHSPELLVSGNYQATVIAEDPEGDKLNYTWELYEESTATSAGGDPEITPPLVATYEGDGPTISFTAPDEPGLYRLFVTVIDEVSGKDGYANIPVRVN